MNERDDEISKKAQIYKDKGQLVHISLKNGRFYNAVIQNIGAEFIEVHDRFLGIVPVFISQIVEIEPFKQEVEGGKEV